MKGRVEVDGQSAAGSLVIISSAAGGSFPARVGEDGYFRADGVPIGPAQVVVLPNDYPTSKSQDVPLAIPKRYGDVSTSGLVLTVGRGRNDFPIKLVSSAP